MGSQSSIRAGRFAARLQRVAQIRPAWIEPHQPVRGFDQHGVQSRVAPRAEGLAEGLMPPPVRPRDLPDEAVTALIRQGRDVSGPLEAIGTPPADILFLSDTKEELDAARAAGMHVTWLVRDGALDSKAAHRQVNSFDEITL